jgi:hypothetical protein
MSKTASVCSLDRYRCGHGPNHTDVTRSWPSYKPVGLQGSAPITRKSVREPEQTFGFTTLRLTNHARGLG